MPTAVGCPPTGEVDDAPGVGEATAPGVAAGGGATALTAPPPPFDKATPIALASVSIVGSLAVTVVAGRLAATPPISAARVSSVCGLVTVGLLAVMIPLPAEPARAPARFVSAHPALRNCCSAATWLGTSCTVIVAAARPTIPVLGTWSGRLLRASQPSTAEPLNANVANTAAPTRGKTVGTNQRCAAFVVVARTGSTASVAVLNDWKAASVRQQIVQPCRCCCMR